MTRKLFFFILFLTIFSFILRLYRVGEPNRYYFDEVYHAVTALAYADNNPDAYDPFAKSPKEGAAYDWLHPPMAKLIQALSIKIFGDNPTGWRLPSVIFGTMIIPATFVLANILFGPMIAIFSSIVIAFENLSLVMSRITMNDVFVTFFILISFIFASLYARSSRSYPERIRFAQFKYVLLTAISLGLAVSSKWTGLYALSVIFVYIAWVYFRGRKILKPSGVFALALLIVIPGLIYLAAYSQFWLQGHTVGQFIDLHRQIWWYQNRRDLEHTYGTTAIFCAPEGLAGPRAFCPWVLDVRPVYFSYEEYGGKAGYIYALGNPSIFWLGIIAIAVLILEFLRERKKEYFLVLLGYFIFWVPWIFSPRILFLYHYLPSIPFMSIALGATLASIYATRYRMLAILIVIVTAAVFFYFFPISTGLPIDPPSIDDYIWLGTWR